MAGCDLFPQTLLEAQPPRRAWGSHQNCLSSHKSPLSEYRDSVAWLGLQVGKLGL